MLRHRPSGVAVLSPTESGGCSSSDITEPRSPRSPESACSAGEEGAGGRMPPWASEPAPPAPRRLAAQPAPTRRPPPPAHRRITEFFNHKMKPHHGLKRDANSINNDDTKRKCLPRTNITNDLEKYISYLSQTLSPKVLLDVERQAGNVASKKPNTSHNYGVVDSTKSTDLKTVSSSNAKGFIDNRSKDHKEKLHSTMNGFVDVRHGSENNKGKNPINTHLGFQNKSLDMKTSIDPSANKLINPSKCSQGPMHKLPIPACSNEALGLRIPSSNFNASSKKITAAKPDSTRINGVVSSTTKLESHMNGVTCGSNNLSLNYMSSKTLMPKKETMKQSNQAAKRTNRKSSACIANSKNLTWSKANNLKQVQMQKQNCMNSVQNITHKPATNETCTTPNINIPNGVRQVPLTVNGNLGNLNVPVTNLPNCHSINIPQPCNGTVTSNNLASFVAVPQNVMITTLRIPQNGIPGTQQMNQHNNLAFNRQNMNVGSPTKLNGQFVFPLVQNINGTVVQIPNLMAKMPNFVLPQTPQLNTQRQDHLQNQQAAQFLFNGTLLKLANTMTSTYPNINKHGPPTSQSLPVMNKNVTGMPAVGMTVQPKSTNYTVNLSHPVLMPQPGFIVTSVPNINVKETWSYSSTNTAPSSQPTCSNPIVHHHPIVNNYAAQTLHSSSIPLAPVKPPDNPIQGTEPPSSTVKETESSEFTLPKSEIPWLSKTVNNNIVPLETNKLKRAFSDIINLSKSAELSSTDQLANKKMEVEQEEVIKAEVTEELKKIEEVSRREETIFTQITVLKDVSSNVQNTVIEANFCSPSTESSESGIGTDKSIDSPSDSQTSKECDEDSRLSLSVSVCSVEAQSQKSPILKQPKTLRFPPKAPPKTNSGKRTSSTDTTSTVNVCLWENCKKEMESDIDLLEHIQIAHVDTQQGKKNYVCLWERCKVRGKPSCSSVWLERHASSHGGNKPYKCIVDGCGRRFTTQILLERHVNNHFDEASPSSSGNKKSTDSVPKLIRRNGKKLRYRRQPWSARMFDFFDSGMMEGLAWRLARSSRWRLGGACPLREPAGNHTLTLHAALAATRYNSAEGRREALLTYYPPHVLEDEWVPEKDVKRVKRVEISELPVHTKVLLYEQFCASYTKPPSPPPRSAPQPVTPRLLPARNCSSSRLLNNLIAKKKAEANNCPATNTPLIYTEDDKSDRVEVSGAKKRKLGRRYGGNSFWPCGR